MFSLSHASTSSDLIATCFEAIWRVDKDSEGNVSKEKLFGVRVSPGSGRYEGLMKKLICVEQYVPLTDKEAQWRG